MILKDKTILVSGVGPGLGREIASRVLRDGGNVVIGARKAESLATAAKELDPSGERILAHAFDITDEDGCKAIIAAAEERFGRLDGLAQVAAAEPMGDLESTPLDDFRTANEVNVIGTVQLVKAAAPAFERAGGGSVVLIGSQSTELPPPSPQLAYSASKGGVQAMTLPVARDLAKDGIRVAAILPGLFHTPMFDGLPDEARDALAASVPFPSRLGTPAEYAQLAISICENVMLNGVNIRLDGAVRLAPR